MPSFTNLLLRHFYAPGIALIAKDTWMKKRSLLLGVSQPRRDDHVKVRAKAHFTEVVTWP